jgi:hypothetical protein
MNQHKKEKALLFELSDDAIFTNILKISTPTYMMQKQKPIITTVAIKCQSVSSKKGYSHFHL